MVRQTDPTKLTGNLRPAMSRGAPSRVKNVRLDVDDGDDADHQLQAEVKASRAASPAKPNPPPRKVVQQNKKPAIYHGKGRSTKATELPPPEFMEKEEDVALTPQQVLEDSQDRKIISALADLRAAVERFSESYFNFKIKGPIDATLHDAPVELLNYVGCVAMGGPNGRAGWRQLIEDPVLRKALVCGIVNRVLHEHVVSSLCFGADAALVSELEAMEQRQVDKDGFYRTEHRAGLINASVKAAGMFKPTTASFLRLTVQLTTLLAPIKALDYLHVDDTNPDAHDPAYTAQLMHLVGLAQQLNHAIRRNGDVVYYFEPVYKDEEFEPSSMKCHNLASMQAECPLWVLGADGGERLPNDPLGDETDVALVRVVCSPGCVAYRKGGGDLGKRLLREDATRPDYSVPPELRKKGGGSAKNVVFGRVLTEKDGFRSKRIARAVVALRWGKPQFQEEPKFRKNYVELKDAVLDDVNGSGAGMAACLIM